MNNALRIVVVAPDLGLPRLPDQTATPQAAHSSALRRALLDNGLHLMATLPPTVFLCESLDQLQPDVVIVDAESGARNVLDHVLVATRHALRPIVVFTNDPDTTHAQDWFTAGVCAYIVAGLAPQRLPAVLHIAMARFRHEQALRGALREARTELHERKTVDRAKGLLMQRQGLSEQKAYEKLRKAAMDKGLRLAEVAQRLLDMATLLD